MAKYQTFNKPITALEMEHLSYGYHPTLYPNRKSRRDYLRSINSGKNKAVQFIFFKISPEKYEYRRRDKVWAIEGGKSLFVRRTIFHEKYDMKRNSKKRKF